MTCYLMRLRRLFAVFALPVLAAACATDAPALGDQPAAPAGDSAALGADSGGDADIEEAVDDTASDGGSETTTRTLRLAIGTNWSGDPADAGPASVGARLIAGLLHEGLTAIAADGTPKPGLAERWFVSDDRLEWTFVLPEGLADGLGEALTAGDVKASFERLADRGPYDQLVIALAVIDGWTEFARGEAISAVGLDAPDDKTLVITLKAPYEPLLELLAAPGYGVTGTSVDGEIRTTGSYRATSDPNWLEAVDPAAVIDRIELVRSDGNGGALLASRRVDFAVLAADDGGTEVPGDVLRQPLDLRAGIAARFAEPASRVATLAALRAEELVVTVANGSLDVSGTLEPSPTSLPAAVTVHVPTGELEPLGAEVAAQLRAAGIEVSLIVLAPSDFAAAIANGDATLFPIVSAGGSWSQSAGLALADPGGPDDLFGVSAGARGALVAAIRAEADPAERASLVSALERLLLEEGLLLPVATFEVRVGLGEDMDALRVRADGTLDLSLFTG